MATQQKVRLLLDENALRRVFEGALSSYISTAGNIYYHYLAKTPLGCQPFDALLVRHGRMIAIEYKYGSRPVYSHQIASLIYVQNAGGLGVVIRYKRLAVERWRLEYDLVWDSCTSNSKKYDSKALSCLSADDVVWNLFHKLT
jgi:hypothetical protein